MFHESERERERERERDRPISMPQKTPILVKLEFSFPINVV